MTMGQMLNVGGVNVFAYRLILIFACLRGLARRELRFSFRNRVDRQVAIFCATAVVMGLIAGHPKSSLGSAGNVLGFYLIFRAIVASVEDAKRVFLQLGIIVIPLALLMVAERMSGKNPFARLGGVPQETQIRQEKNRAQGPFRHPILAGTAGALMMVPLIGMFKQYRTAVIVGSVAGLAILASSSSSGPYLTLAIGCTGLAIYRYRRNMRKILKGVLAAIICLEIIMKDHVWYIFARFDLVGGSTGWHRSELITQAFKHIREWWFCGTSYTRHWMPSGVSWSPDHVDITNQYIFVGVEGGLPLMIVFIAMLVTASICSYKVTLANEDVPESSYFCWSIWAMLVSQIITFLSVGYFDQIIAIMCLNLAIIGSLWEIVRTGEVRKEAPEEPENLPSSRFYLQRCHI
jgi:hypothetical protein